MALLAHNSRTSMFWRLWWRAVSVKRSQAALALGSLAVGAALTSMLLNLYSDVRQKMTEDVRAYGANVVIASAGSEGGAANNALVNEAALGTLSEFAHQTPGAVFTPVLYGVVRVSVGSSGARMAESENAVATGADFGLMRRLAPGWREAGERVAVDLPPGECAVGTQLASRLHLHAGDSLQLSPMESANTSTWRIAQVLTTGASEDNQVFVPLAALQSALGLAGKVTLVQANVPGETREVEGAVKRLSAMLPGLDVRPIRQIVYSEGKVLGTIRWLLLSLTVLILVIIAICVTATMTAIVLERRKDIGVMKALGAPDQLLARMFITEGASFGIVAGVLGYGLGAILARGLDQRLFGVGLRLNAWTFPVVCGLTVALAVIAAQVPLGIVRAVEPTVVLKGE